MAAVHGWMLVTNHHTECSRFLSAEHCQDYIKLERNSDFLMIFHGAFWVRLPGYLTFSYSDAKWDKCRGQHSHVCRDTKRKSARGHSFVNFRGSRIEEGAYNWN